jgi:hypothetical protein
MEASQSRLVISVALFLFCCGCSSPAAKPIWTNDLLQNPVYADRVKQEDERPVRRFASPQVAFVGSKTLAISFTDDAQTIMTDLSQLRHFHFRTIFVNAEDGQFEDHELSWPTIDDDAKLLPMRDGGFVVVAGQQLYRYSAEFRLTAQTPVPPDPGNDSGGEFAYQPPYVGVRQLKHWIAEEDSSEEYIVLRHSTLQKISFFWLDDRLQVLNVPILNGPIDSRGWAVRYSISDKFILQGSLIADRSGKWQPFCPAYKNSAATFANNDKVFVAHNGGGNIRYALVTTGCVQLLDLPGAAHSQLFYLQNGAVVARAASGNRIAISEGSMENAMSGVIAATNIHVWDLDPAQEALNLPLVPQVKRGRIVRGPALAAALSPDGKQVAVLLGTRLSLYAL